MTETTIATFPVLDWKAGAGPEGTVVLQPRYLTHVGDKSGQSLTLIMTAEQAKTLAQHLLKTAAVSEASQTDTGTNH